MKISMPYILIIIAFFLLASFWGFYISIKTPKSISQVNPTNYGLEYEELTFKTSDDLNLSAWWIPHTNPDAKTIILLHGYPADKGNILPIMYFLNEKYNLLLFDFRYLGSSEGKYSTVGAEEVKDLAAAIEYLKSREINEVGVWGLSMGGAVALMTAPNAPEIKAIMADSAYASLSLMSYELYRIPFLKYPLGYLTGEWSQLILGIDIKKVSPESSVKNLSIPILIYHSKADRVISFENAKRIQEALDNNPKAEFWFEEKLGHEDHPENYEKRVMEFFDKNL